MSHPPSAPSGIPGHPLSPLCGPCHTHRQSLTPVLHTHTHSHTDSHTNSVSYKHTHSLTHRHSYTYIYTHTHNNTTLWLPFHQSPIFTCIYLDCITWQKLEDWKTTAYISQMTIHLDSPGHNHTCDRVSCPQTPKGLATLTAVSYADGLHHAVKHALCRLNGFTPTMKQTEKTIQTKEVEDN